MPSTPTVGSDLATSLGRVIPRTVSSPIPSPARPAPPPPPSETPAEPFFTAVDFKALDGLSYQNGPLLVRLVSAAPVRKIRRDLHRAISDAFQSDYVELVHIDFTEGSLWGHVKVKVKQVGAWMRRTAAATVQWARNHKDTIDFWLRTINNLLSILTNIMRILGWWFGGGTAPGTA